MAPIKYKDGYRYVLHADYECKVDIAPAEQIDAGFIMLSTAGDLLIKQGYAWDGPSGPTFDTCSFMRGSLIHDALYQLIRERHLSMDWFEQSNRELYRACLEDGMSRLRAAYVLKAVSLFGRKFAKPAKGIVLTAP